MKAWVESTSLGRYRVRTRLPDGRKVTVGEGATFERREDAERMCLVVTETMRDADEYGLTVAAFGDKWIQTRELTPECRDAKNERGRFKQYIEDDEIGRALLRNVRRGDVIDWTRRLLRRVARGTVKNALTLLRGIFRAAHDKGLVKVNVALDVRLPRATQTEEPWTYLIPEEQARLIDAFAHPERHIIAFAIGTGLRAGELCALHLRDVHVDIEHPHVVVRYGAPAKEPTKSGRIREVPLFGVGLDAARAWLAALPGYAAKNPHGLMFPRLRGGYRDPAHVIPWRRDPKREPLLGGHQSWKDGLDAAELGRDARWHDLRHTCASSLVSGWWGRSWSLEEVREMLGHSSIAVTERYAHLAGTAVRRAAAETRAAAPRLPHAPRRALPENLNDVAGSHFRDLNSRPTVYETPADRSDIATIEPAWGNRGANVARELLEAVARGDGSQATQLAAALAMAVLDAPEARLAMAVAAGGPLAVTHAVRLAELVMIRAEVGAARGETG